MIQLRGVLFAATSVVVLALPGNARAGCGGWHVPSANASSVPSRIIGSPDGAFTTRIIVRDLAANPVVGSKVYLELGSVAQSAVCPTPCVGCSRLVGADSLVGIVKTTDCSGMVEFDLRAASLVRGGVMRVFADGVLLAGGYDPSVRLVSTDLNGDLTVTDADVTLAQAAIADGDLRADLDGSGVVTTADLKFIRAHLGATCLAPTSVRHTSWGTLKGAYR